VVRGKVPSRRRYIHSQMVTIQLATTTLESRRMSLLGCKESNRDRIICDRSAAE
jgi:hypothetical protein